MPKTRKSHPPSLKAKVAVETIKAHKTAAQIAQMFGVHPTQVGGSGRSRRCSRVARYLRQRPRADTPAGRHGEGRTVQTDRPTESGVGLSQKKSWPHRLTTNAHGSIRLIGASASNSSANCWECPRSTYYYQPRPESAENLRLLRVLDELYLKLPFFGSRKMAVKLGVGRHRANGG